MGQVSFSLTHVHCQILLDLHYVRYSDSLQAARSGNRIPVRGEIFRNPLDTYNGYQVSPGGKKAGPWR